MHAPARLERRQSIPRTPLARLAASEASQQSFETILVRRHSLTRLQDATHPGFFFFLLVYLVQCLVCGWNHQRLVREKLCVDVRVVAPRVSRDLKSELEEEPLNLCQGSSDGSHRFVFGSRMSRRKGDAREYKGRGTEGE